jgi:hypothetical protein
MVTPSRKNPHGRTVNRTRDLMISIQKLWPLDHEAGLRKESCFYTSLRTECHQIACHITSNCLLLIERQLQNFPWAWVKQYFTYTTELLSKVPINQPCSNTVQVVYRYLNNMCCCFNTQCAEFRRAFCYQRSVKGELGFIYTSTD